MTDIVIEPYFNRDRSALPHAEMPDRTAGFWGTSQVRLPSDLTGSSRLARQQADECQGCKFSSCSLSEEGCPLTELREIRKAYDLMRLGREMEALKTFVKGSPFMSAYKVCEAPCGPGCNHNASNSGIITPVLEHHLGEFLRTVFKSGEYRGPNFEKVRRADAQRIAIIGAGIAGMQAAWEILKAGHIPVIFDRERLPGGLILKGIPPTHLEAMSNEEGKKTHYMEFMYEFLRHCGVGFRLGQNLGVDIGIEPSGDGRNTNVGSEKFAGVIYAMGAQKPLVIPALKDFPHVLGFRTMLDTAISEYYGYESDPCPVQAGQSVLIVGNRYTARDCALMSVRRGAKVYVLMRSEEIEASKVPWKHSEDPRVEIINVSNSENFTLYPQTEIAAVELQGDKKIVTFDSKTEKVPASMAFDHIIPATGSVSEGIDMVTSKFGDSVLEGLHEIAGDMDPKAQKILPGAARSGAEAAWRLVRKLSTEAAA